MKSQWSSWGSCTSACGHNPLLPGWNQNRTRTTITPASCGGTCSGANLETRKCPPPPGGCCPVDCRVSSAWSNWSPAVLCDETVTQVRTRSIVQAASCGGKSCPTTRQTRWTKGPCCIQNCQYTWGSWSQCSGTCGSGTRARLPVITVHPRCGGTPCPSFSSQKCQRYLTINCKARILFEIINAFAHPRE